MKIKITSDSTCDLSSDIIEKYNITITPLSVLMDNQSYLDCIDIMPSDIFKHVASGGDLCTTSAVNTAAYEKLFNELSPIYDAIIHISLGSGFSSSYQNACIASAKLPNVHIIDSKNLSTGQGHVVLEACEKAAEDCDDIDELCSYLNDLTSRVEASFILDRLEYMVKGGRCSMVAALGANLLKLKPCIEVRDNKMSVAKKYRGAYTKCLDAYINERLANRDDIVNDKIFITNTPVSDDDMKVALSCVKKYGDFKRIIKTNAGCTISCHCGPGTLGVLFIRK